MASYPPGFDFNDPNSSGGIAPNKGAPRYPFVKVVTHKIGRAPSRLWNVACAYKRKVRSYTVELPGYPKGVAVLFLVDIGEIQRARNSGWGKDLTDLWLEHTEDERVDGWCVRHLREHFDDPEDMDPRSVVWLTKIMEKMEAERVAALEAKGPEWIDEVDEDTPGPGPYKVTHHDTPPEGALSATITAEVTPDGAVAPGGVEITNLATGEVVTPDPDGPIPGAEVPDDPDAPRLDASAQPTLLTVSSGGTGPDLEVEMLDEALRVSEMEFRDLQTELKARGLSAGGTTEALRERLSKALAED